MSLLARCGCTHLSSLFLSLSLCLSLTLSLSVCCLPRCTELSPALTEAQCPQQLLQLALRDPSVFPTRIALFSLGTLAAYEPCRQALLAAVPSITDLIRWFKRPQEAPEVTSASCDLCHLTTRAYCLALLHLISLCYLSLSLCG